jgi:hypothetical protein
MRTFGVLAFGCVTGMALAADPVASQPAPLPDWLSIPQTGIALQEGSKLLPPLDVGQDKTSGLGTGTLSVGAELLWLRPTGGSAAFSQPHVGTSIMWQGGAGRGIGWDLSYHGFGR